MKRSLLATLWIGILAAAGVIALQRSGLLHHVETSFDRWISPRSALPPNDELAPGNYLLVVGLAFAAGWVLLEVTKWRQRLGLLLLLLAELVVAAWVLSVARIYFQPLPGMLVALFAAALVFLSGLTGAARRRRATATLFAGRLEEASISRLLARTAPDLRVARSYNVSFVHCEVSNQPELIAEFSPPDYAALMLKLCDAAATCFLKEGGYLHAADGEGVRVFFGFPHSSANAAAAAARAALALRGRLRSAAADPLGKVDLRVGISAGPVVASVPEGGAEIMISGEAIELARRLAGANQLYGTQILLGPHAFSAARAQVVARPIDFLPSNEAHERLEAYELLSMTSEASEAELAARDSFWMGLVYFRAHRWSDAFAAFNRALRGDSETDRPVHWYLRRLEPVILHMATEPAPVLDRHSPL